MKWLLWQRLCNTCTTTYMNTCTHTWTHVHTHRHMYTHTGTQLSTHIHYVLMYITHTHVISDCNNLTFVTGYLSDAWFVSLNTLYGKHVYINLCTRCVSGRGCVCGYVFVCTYECMGGYFVLAHCLSMNSTSCFWEWDCPFCSCTHVR